MENSNNNLTMTENILKYIIFALAGLGLILPMLVSYVLDYQFVEVCILCFLTMIVIPRFCLDEKKRVDKDGAFMVIMMNIFISIAMIIKYKWMH